MHHTELLEKITVLIKRSANTQLSQLEYDLLMQHIRTLYDALSNERKGITPVITPVQNEVPAVTHTPIKTEPVITIETLPVTEPVLQREPVIQPKIEEPVVTAQKRKSSLNEGIKSSESLNEKLKTATTEMHRKFASKHLRDMIDLNRRYVLVNELFKGDTIEFAKAVHEIDSTEEFTIAESYIKSTLWPQFGWDETSQAARLFTRLVKQKFGVE